MKFFLPKQSIFFNLIKELSVSLKEMSTLYQDFASNFNNFEDYSKKAKEIEHKADAKSHQIIEELNKTFITPFDREDIYLLAQELDNIIDLIENAINNINIYEIREKKGAIDDFAPIITKSADALGEMLEILETQKQTSKLTELKVKVHELEDEGDIIFQKSIKKLFQKEQDPIKVIKWKDILENLENVMDEYQKVSDVIEGIMVKSK